MGLFFITKLLPFIKVNILLGLDRTGELTQPDLQPDVQTDRQGASGVEDVRELRSADVQRKRKRLQRVRPRL